MKTTFALATILLASSASAVEPTRTPATLGNPYPNAAALMNGRTPMELAKNQTLIRAAADVDQARVQVRGHVLTMRQLKADAHDARKDAAEVAQIDANYMRFYNRHATPTEIDAMQKRAVGAATQFEQQRKDLLPVLRSDYEQLRDAKAALRKMNWTE